jgi:hypothetical protein
MKKFISFAFAALLILSTLVGCGSNPNDTTPDAEDTQNGIQAYGPDAWDGSVASSFDGGDGSETDPYRIATAEQLAFLASEINSGKNYTGKHFALTSDIELADRPWTPIGTSDHPFSGSFDGRGFRIKNVNISIIHDYVTKEGNAEMKSGDAGLFGSCLDASFSNIVLDKVCVSIDNINAYQMLKVAALVGCIDINSDSYISNVKINKCTTKFSGNTKDPNPRSSLDIGGIIGNAKIFESAKYTMSTLESDIDIKMSNSLGYNNIGAVVGRVNNKSVLTCKNTACYVSIEKDSIQRDEAGGIIGMCQTYANAQTKLENAFSSVRSNVRSKGSNNGNLSDRYCYINAAIGSASVHGKSDGRYEFINVFGHVQPKGEKAGFSEAYYTLYTTDGEETYTETNCKGCDSLPDNHGFDTNIWDVSNPAKPVLK